MQLRLTLALWFLVMFAGCSTQTASKKTSDQENSGKATSSETQSAGSVSANSGEASFAGTGDGEKVVVDAVAEVKPGSDEVQVVSFDELNLGMPEDARFRPIMLKYNDGRAEQLLNTRINIAGHMNPPDELSGIKEFVLLKNKECLFGPGGQADHLMRIQMADGQTTDYTDKVIYVEGLLKLNPFPDDQPYTWSIYDLEATKVSTRPPSRLR